MSSLSCLCCFVFAYLYFAICEFVYLYLEFINSTLWLDLSYLHLSFWYSYFPIFSNLARWRFNNETIVLSLYLYPKNNTTLVAHTKT